MTEASLITQVSAAVEKYCGRNFTQKSESATLDGGLDYLILPTAPVISITSVTDTDSGSILDPSDYDYYPSSGVLYLKDSSKWGLGRQRWEIAYEAGHIDTPEDVKLAVAMEVKARLEHLDPRVQKEGVGDYNYELGARDGFFSPEARDLLAKYRFYVL